MLLPDLTATLILLHRSLALPARVAPGTDDWLQAPGVKLNDVAATLPVFCRLMVVVFGAPPATSGVLVPPYLLIVEQVAVLVFAPAPSVLLQVALPDVSFMVSVPVVAVFRLFWMLAAKPAKVGVKVKAISSALSVPVAIKPKCLLFWPFVMVRSPLWLSF